MAEVEASSPTRSRFCRPVLPRPLLIDSPALRTRRPSESQSRHCGCPRPSRTSSFREARAVPLMTSPEQHLTLRIDQVNLRGCDLVIEPTPTLRADKVGLGTGDGNQTHHE